ncbi:photosynthetic reaction center cytochrome PufC [Sphingobium algorifonticola]|uniref:Photosynthetic reaction center cytochrome c subunit n=1 Tax=Sphingobium algorifonticola TaxID=2008318 RepID=A0A437J5K4_9SPHN|nr:photosynthetic reaction center cytochrome PufC [Sphingobium algorifonticola]RVT40222.1 photosynthetic reaction center cytochrome c subunit [Sphingobium algorifonticola]
MNGYRHAAAAGAALGSLILLTGCELGPKTVSQVGYRGAGLNQINDPDSTAKASAIPAPPYAVPEDSGPLASESYQNVQVLGGVSAERFNHLMAAITQWVAPPAEGCNYCHNPNNLASDEKYTKIVARRMIQMTWNINTKYASHVKQTGVTCYTCHAGNAVPKNMWAMSDAPGTPTRIRGNKFGQNAPNPAVGYASLPYDPFAAYLGQKNDNIRVASKTVYPTAAQTASTKDAESTYGLMMHMSTALGVNCTYCHNSQSFSSWPLSRGQRATAWYGLRMVGETNAEYITSLQNVFPAYRKGPHGDVYKVNCTTCHQGLNKPLNGVSMLPDNPVLRAPPAMRAAALPGPADNAADPADAANATAPVGGTQPVGTE